MMNLFNGGNPFHAADVLNGVTNGVGSVAGVGGSGIGIDVTQAAATVASAVAASFPTNVVPMPMPPSTGVVAREITRASDLMLMQFPPIRWALQDIIPEGCTLLSGAPKIGKSWLALQLGLAVASGTAMFGKECIQGDVLYLALEDNKRRIQRRIGAVGGDYRNTPGRLYLATEWAEGPAAIMELGLWLRCNPGTRLVIIDVLEKVRAKSQGNQKIYEGDYGAVAAFTKLAGEYGVSIVIIHHVRKSQQDSDPFERVSGSYGLTGAADTVLILDRTHNGVTLYGRGRDSDELEKALRLNHCQWELLGDAAEVHMTGERVKVLDVLRAIGAEEPALKSGDIAKAIGSTVSAVSKLLHKLAGDGLVVKDGYGKYRMSPVSPGPQP